MSDLAVFCVLSMSMFQSLGDDVSRNCLDAAACSCIPSRHLKFSIAALFGVGVLIACLALRRYIDLFRDENDYNYFEKLGFLARFGVHTAWYQFGELYNNDVGSRLV